jgi:formate hydrogenlyase subunit 3/multisubunit Na+/H+ antiporter MnhD subunit
MLDYRGPVASIVFAWYLWLIPLAPFAGALVLAHLGLSQRRARAAGQRLRAISPMLAFRVTVAALGVSSLSLLAGALRLARHPSPSPVLFAHGSRLVRIGHLDLGLDLSLDALSAPVALGVALFILALTVAASPATKRAKASWTFYVFVLSLAGSALLGLLADNLPLFVAGWELTFFFAYCSTAFVAKDGSPRRGVFLAGQLGALGFLLAGALLFWGLGGSWSELDYEPDLGPRFAAVAEEGAAVGTGKSLLTMTSHAGARVYLDGAQVPMAERPPFTRLPIDAGTHSFRIQADGDDAILHEVLLPSGREVSLVPIGPVLGFREMRQQLSSTNAQGEFVLREALLEKRDRGAAAITLVTLACLALLFATASAAALIPFHGWVADLTRHTRNLRPWRAAVLTLIVALPPALALYLLVRLHFVLELSTEVSSIMAWWGALTALYGALLGTYERTPEQLACRIGVSALGVAVLGIAGGQRLGGLLHLAIVMACFGALMLARGGPPRPMKIAAVAMSFAPVPFVGAFWSVTAIARDTFEHQGVAMFSLLTAAIAATSFSLARLTPGDGASPPPPRLAGAVAMGLAVFAATAPIVFGFGSALSKKHSTVVALMVSMASLGGWGLARRSAAIPTNDGVDRDLLARTVTSGARALLSTAQRSAGNVERWVIAGAFGTIAGVVRAAIWLQVRLLEPVLQAPAKVLGLGPPGPINALETERSERFALHVLLAAFGIAMVLFLVSR